MKYFNKEQLDILKKYEYYFITVIKYGYKRNTTREDNEYIVALYEKTTNEKLIHNYTCNQCIFNNFKTVGNLYFKSKEYWENKALQEDKITEVEQQPTTPKKRGRKPSKTTK